MTVRTETVAIGFISEVRDLFAKVGDEKERWEQIARLLQELLADARLKEQSIAWPDCRRGGQDQRAENLLFYEDPEYGFVVNGLVKSPHSRTQIHDHAHLWTAYGVLDGGETIERYERVDDGSRPGYAELRQTASFGVEPGAVDLVPPWQIHAEGSGDDRTVAVIVRSAKPGDFLQNRYNPEKKTTWQGYGPVQIPFELT